MPTRSIKTLAAVLLVITLALPQSTCARYEGPNGQVRMSVPRDAQPGTYRRVVERHYALDNFRPTEAGSWLLLAAFVWPFPLLARAVRRPSSRLTRALWYGEPVLAVASAYLIWRRSGLFATPASGAYLAVAANGVYFLAWVRECVQRVQSKGHEAGA